MPLQIPTDSPSPQTAVLARRLAFAQGSLALACSPLAADTCWGACFSFVRCRDGDVVGSLLEALVGSVVDLVEEHVVQLQAALSRVRAGHGRVDCGWRRGEI